MIYKIYNINIYVKKLLIYLNYYLNIFYIWQHLSIDSQCWQSIYTFELCSSASLYHPFPLAKFLKEKPLLDAGPSAPHTPRYGPESSSESPSAHLEPQRRMFSAIKICFNRMYFRVRGIICTPLSVHPFFGKQ